MKKIFNLFDLVTLFIFVINLIALSLLKISLIKQGPYFVGFFWFFVLYSYQIKGHKGRKGFSFLSIIFSIDQNFKSNLLKRNFQTLWVLDFIFPSILGVIVFFGFYEGWAFFFAGLFLGRPCFIFSKKLLAKGT